MAAPTTDRGGIQQTIRALKADGWEVDAVDDGDYEDVEVKTEKEAVDAIMAVDDALLYVRKGEEVAWIRFVLGNDPEEVICNHTVNLSDVLDPLTRDWF